MIINRLREAVSSRIVRITAILFTALCIAFTTWTSGISFAGKEGVFINSSVYFTLENVALSTGSSNQTMQFQLQLNNDGDSIIDYNYYGVKVTSTSGGSYYAQLSKQADAQVPGHSAISYYYVSTIPGGLDASQLQVTVFERNGNGSSVRDVGSLSVANAQSIGQTNHQLLVNLADVDTAVATNSFVSYQAVKAVTLPQDGKWTILVDAMVTPMGTETITLPSGIKYLLHDGQGRTLSLSSNAVQGTSINAGQSKHILLSTTMDTLPSTDAMTLDLSLDSAGISSLGKLSLAPLFQLAKMGERVPYVLNGREGITLELQKAEQQQISNKNGAIFTAVLHNDGKSTIKAPSLQGVLISKEATLSVNAAAVVVPETYLAPGESGAYRFVAQLPDGTAAEKLQFLISEAASDTSSATAKTNSSASTGSTSTAGSNSNTSASNTTSNGSSNSTEGASSIGSIPILAATLQEGLTAGSNMNNIPQYELGQPIVFDSSSELIDSNLQVSLVELNGHSDSESGYQTVIAKFKLLNNSNETLQIPSFGTSLTDITGTTYPGARQTTALQELIPNAAYVYSYSFMLPPSAKGQFKLSLTDASNASNIKVPIADYKVSVANTGEEDPQAVTKKLSLYPFNVTMDYWTINAQYSSGSYTYSLKGNFDIKKSEQVIVDDTFSTLEFEVVDATNRILGSTTHKLQGTGKLISGLQTITFTDVKSEQLEYPVSIRVYEVITTSTGTAKRLLATLTQ
ncbi:hypothetical protein GC093_33730 [Paenibacillus sp. LMG 31456]|uniref:Uncharacterized protein n=1 Tax=Paenibacillus foliorum TaxID=2654974 RepID=A0A972K4K0_9BACL|nr:hypothetical protein [Paenibacillus foliorum]NOU98155.1 hypothetical protein [Paenibacillus foliorum]